MEKKGYGYYRLWKSYPVSYALPPYQRFSLNQIANSAASIIPLTAFRIYYLSTISSSTLPDQTFSSYHGYLATIIQLNFAIFMACVPFLKPFMESMSSGGMASTVNPMDSSYGKGSKLSTLISSYSNRKASKLNGSYRMENLSESRLNENSGTSRASEANANSLQNIRPSAESDSFHFGITSANDEENLGTLRPDKVMSFSHVRHAPLEESETRSSVGSDKMIIKRTTEWNVREEYEHPMGDDHRREGK